MLFCTFDRIVFRFYIIRPILIHQIWHGWPHTSYVWRNNFPELSKEYRVIALDLPGLGKSGKAEKYDTKCIASLVDKFVDSLEIDKFHLVGHDIGSWVSVERFFYSIKNCFISSLATGGLKLFNETLYKC